MIAILIDRDGTRREVNDVFDGALSVACFRPDPMPRRAVAADLFEGPPSGVDRADIFATEEGAAWWRQRYGRPGTMVRYVRAIRQDETGQFITNEYREDAVQGS